MNDLHLALLLIAAVLLVGLYLYGKWQERKALRRLDDSMRTGVADALLVGTGVEPARHAPPRIEPRLEAEVSPAAALVERELPEQSGVASTPVDGWLEDPLLDFVLELRCSHAFDGVAALEARAQLERLELPLPTHLAVWDPRAQQWTAPDRFGFYSEMLIAVQMATRRQLLGEIEASRFVACVQQIAVSIDADFDAPDVAKLVAQAAELDRLCARFDVQITLTLESLGGAWSHEVLAAEIQQAGFEQVEPICWQRPGDDGQPLLTVTATSLLADRLSIALDVPLVAADQVPLAVLFATAHQLAPRLNARIVDDNGRPIESAAQAAIEGELEKLYDEMRAAGLEPGALRARRMYFA
jgi:hypothetical protein